MGDGAVFGRFENGWEVSFRDGHCTSVSPNSRMINDVIMREAWGRGSCSVTGHRPGGICPAAFWLKKRRQSETAWLLARIAGLDLRRGPRRRTRLEPNVERLYVRPHPDDPNRVIIDLAALRDLVARGAVAAFDSQHVDGDPDFSSLGFYEQPALEDAMLGGLRMVGTVDEASDEDGLRAYAADLRWYIRPSGKSVDYS
jgi:hypothetical protein